MTLYAKLEEVEDKEQTASVSISSNNSQSAKTSVSSEVSEKMLIKFDGSKNKLYKFVDNCDKTYDLVKPEIKDVLFAITETKLTDNTRTIVRNRAFHDRNTLKAIY